VELSAVYRYLLRNNSQKFTILKEELDFIQSFMHLLKTRYEEGILFDISVDRSFHRHLIAPLSLQLLLENVVKHNEVSDNKPLKISIYTDPNNYLVIANTRNPKGISHLSNGFGLDNIVSRYALLQKREVVIIKSEEEFKVYLPLIKPFTDDHFNH
jgi:LytS/YehU family sensor histidine kinase